MPRKANNTARDDFSIKIVVFAKSGSFIHRWYPVLR